LSLDESDDEDIINDEKNIKEVVNDEKQKSKPVINANFKTQKGKSSKKTY